MVIMTTKSKLFSLDEETNAYVETIPKNKRSAAIREALKLHKFQHRVEKNTINPQIKVKYIGKT